MFDDDVHEVSEREMKENFTFYEKLYEEQQQIIEAKQNFDTFRHGLTAFISLQRAATTSEAHHQTDTNCQYSRHFRPLTRSFLPVLRCRGPCPWLGDNFDEGEFT
jgi:hypothetical protein